MEPGLEANVDSFTHGSFVVVLNFLRSQQSIS
jgi:hypothetical protein